MTWGASTPDLEMYVKHPKEVFQLIEDTKQEDHRRFVESRKQNRYKNERKHTGGKRNARMTEIEFAEFTASHPNAVPEKKTL